MILGVLSLFLLTACTSGSGQMETTPSTEPTNNVMTDYEKVPEDNIFYTSDKDGVLKLLEHGTGIILLGFKECPWCQAYAPYLDEVSKEYDLKV